MPLPPMQLPELPRHLEPRREQRFGRGYIPRQRGGSTPVRHRHRRRRRVLSVCPPATFGIFNAMYTNNAGGSASTLRTRSGKIPWAMFYSNLTDETLLDTDFGVMEDRTLDYLWLGSLGNAPLAPLQFLTPASPTTTEDNWIDDNVWLPTPGSDEETACIDYLAAGGDIVVGIDYRAAFTLVDNTSETLTLTTDCATMVADFNTFLSNIGSDTTLQTWLDEPVFDEYHFSAVPGSNIYRPSLSLPYTRPLSTWEYSKVYRSREASTGTVSMPFTFTNEVYQNSHRNNLFWYNPDPSTHYEYGRAFTTRFASSTEFPSPEYQVQKWGPWYTFQHLSNPWGDFGYSGTEVLFPLTLIENVGGGRVHFVRCHSHLGRHYPETLVDRASAKLCRTITWGRGFEIAEAISHNGKSFVTASTNMTAHTRLAWSSVELTETKYTGDAPVAFTSSSATVFHIETPEENTGEYLMISWGRQPFSPKRPLATVAEHEFTHSVIGPASARGYEHAEADPEIAAMISAGILPAGETTYNVQPLIIEHPPTTFAGSHEAPFDGTSFDHIVLQANIFSQYLLRTWNGSSYSTVHDRIDFHPVPVIWQDGKTYGLLNAPATRLTFDNPSGIGLNANNGFCHVAVSAMQDITNWPTIVDGTPDLSATGGLFAVGFAALLSGLKDGKSLAVDGQAYQINVPIGSIDASVSFNSATMQSKFADNTNGLTVVDFGVT